MGFKYKIDEEFRDLMPPTSAEERQLLMESLKKDGCRHKIVVMKDGTILDGHNRYAICTELNIPFDHTVQSTIETRGAAIEWILVNQLARRNLTDLARIGLAEKLFSLRAEQGKSNQAHGLTGPGRTLSQKSAKASVDTRAEVAQAAGVSHDTVSKARKILKKGVPKLIKAVQEEKISVNAAYKLADLTPRKQEELIESGVAEMKRAAVALGKQRMVEKPVQDFEQLLAEKNRLSQECERLQSELEQALRANAELRRRLQALEDHEPQVDADRRVEA